MTTLVHPRTAVLRDPDLPAVQSLLSSDGSDPLRAVVEAGGATLLSSSIAAVTWWPGTSIAVTYRAEVVTHGAPSATHEFVAVSGSIPDGALVVSDGADAVGVWRLPDDPALPGLAACLDPGRAGDVIAALGGTPHAVATALRAYRPGRRAVVAVMGTDPGLYFKVVRPSRVEALHRRHRALPGPLPVPHSLGFDRRLGILALEALPGRTLRRALEDDTGDLPDPSAVVTLASELSSPADDRTAPSPIERVGPLCALLHRIVPEESERLARLVEMIGEDEVVDRVACHGDFYEAQLLVDGARIVGLLDVDTYGWGRPGDDPATMLAHLAVWARLSKHPGRVNRYASDLLRRWDALHEPGDLRRRVSAVILGLATGPFRVQRADWPAETIGRIALAERWIESSARVDERHLIAGSG